ncbi:DUF397 domain-containing protein [Streptomyces sp. NPDC002536]
MPDLIWCKSSFSGSGQDDCIELAVDHNRTVRLRESDRPAGVLAVRPAVLHALLRHVARTVGSHPAGAES